MYVCIDCAWRHDQREIDIDLVDAEPQENGNLTSHKMCEQSLSFCQGHFKIR